MTLDLALNHREPRLQIAGIDAIRRHTDKKGLAEDVSLQRSAAIALADLRQRFDFPSGGHRLAMSPGHSEAAMSDLLGDLFKLLADRVKNANLKKGLEALKNNSSTDSKQPTVQEAPAPKTPSLDNKIPKAPTTRAYPVKFRCVQRESNRRFGLIVDVFWESSDGKLSSLADCLVAEEVIYPQPQNPPFEQQNNGFAGAFVAGRAYIIPEQGKSASEGKGQDIHQYSSQHVRVPCPQIREASFVVKQRYVYRYRDTAGPWLTIPGAVYTITYKFIQHQSSSNARQYNWCVETLKVGNGEQHRSYEFGGSYTV